MIRLSGSNVTNLLQYLFIWDRFTWYSSYAIIVFVNILLQTQLVILLLLKYFIIANKDAMELLEL